jgi:hypothetical protein
MQWKGGGTVELVPLCIYIFVSNGRGNKPHAILHISYQLLPLHTHYTTMLEEINDPEDMFDIEFASNLLFGLTNLDHCKALLSSLPLRRCSRMRRRPQVG